ncbi:MAG: DUF3097 family protein [Actinomycetales bacterium]|nr:DUF3097 family protein [Actinomycetales bacterium]
MTDRYGPDVLAGDWRSRGRTPVAEVPATRDLVVELAPDPERPGDEGFVGAVVAVEKQRVGLEDRAGRVRWFPLGGGFLVDGAPVRLVAPSAAPGAAARTTSGGRAAPSAGNAAVRARTARASRLLVEGRHDAELVEKVWGPDLRVEGVAVEYLEGVDRLEEELAAFGPGPDQRVGVLVDHLVPGSKESRIAAALGGPHVRILGHPFVDVWQAVRPERLGIAAWPEVPRGIEWKVGVCAALGWPHGDREDLARAWQRILGSVRHYADLETALLTPVEQLIDFVAADPAPEPAR